MIFNLVAKAKNTFQQSNTINSTVWLTGGFASSQLIRLGSNLILTRLLVPEYFGLVAIVQAILSFFIMMTDIGLLPSVINTKRDKDPDFMQTIWSVQLVGAMIVCLLVLISAYPISLVYDEPLLFPLLAFMAITSLLSGFNSVSMLLEQKYIRQKQLVKNQVTSQILSALVMIAVAYYFETVWALVLGNLASISYILWASYGTFQTHYSKFKLEKTAFHEIITFGKWIFISSLFTYLAMRSTPVLLGGWLTMEQLGVFTIAATLAGVFEGIVNTVSQKVLQPRFRQLIDGNEVDKIDKIRLKFVLLFTLPTILLAIVGDHLIYFLYDDRYVWAGTVIQLLVLGRVARLLEFTSRPLLASLGDSKSLMYTQAISACVGISLIVFMGVNFDINALILTVSLLPFFDYLVVRYFLGRHQMTIFSKDWGIILLSVSIIIFAWFGLDSSAADVLRHVF